MLILWVAIVPDENSDGICDIGLSGGHCVHKASNRQLVYGQIAGFLVGLSLVKLHCYCSGNCPGLIHSELHQDHPDVALLMDVNHVKLPIEFDIHAEIEGITPMIMHPEPLLHMILYLPNEALVGNDEEIIDVQNNCRNDYALILIVEYKQSSINT